MKKQPFKISAGKFKAQCLQLMDEVQAKQTAIIITKRGKPVAKLVPFEEVPPPPLFGYLQGSVIVQGDIITPFEESWEADD